MYSQIYTPSYGYGEVSGWGPSDPYYGSSYAQPYYPSSGQEAYQSYFGSSTYAYSANAPIQASGGSYNEPYEIIDESQLGQPIAFSETASLVQQPAFNPGSVSNSNTLESLYRKNYVVTKSETDRIKEYFKTHETVGEAEFITLSSELAPQEGVNKLAEEQFYRFSDNNGKLNFDDFLVAYAFVRFKKFGGAPFSYSYF